jgi:hypothetical protein
MNILYLFNQIAWWFFDKIYHGFVRCSMDGVFVVSWCAFVSIVSKRHFKGTWKCGKGDNLFALGYYFRCTRVFVTLIVQHDIGINMPYFMCSTYGWWIKQVFLAKMGPSNYVVCFLDKFMSNSTLYIQLQ